MLLTDGGFAEYWPPIVIIPVILISTWLWLTRRIRTRLKRRQNSDDPLERAYAVRKAAVELTYHVLWGWFMVGFYLSTLVWPRAWVWVHVPILVVAMLWLTLKEARRLIAVEQE